MSTIKLSIVSLLLILLSFNLKAEKAGFYYSYEGNATDSIYSFGVNVLEERNDFQVSLGSSINFSQILTSDNLFEEYTSWEGHVKFGYFSSIILYAEFGIDIGELLIYDLKHDSGIQTTYTNQDPYNENTDGVDSYIGFGTGFQLKDLSVEAFVRLREIDSLNWEAQSHVFSGVKFAVTF
ncbi:MAG: hypothetical protein OEY19_07570 [Gammaproteobacteria bacterium]|nr:hypothetical protein [Gammaproteobacteria bacterium]MDH5630040.1 hypothetical protein [Gammaproteobacteria bacterium]